MRWRDRTRRRRAGRTTGSPEQAASVVPVLRHELATGARSAAVAVPSPLALARLHLHGDEAERGAPGIGLGE